MRTETDLPHLVREPVRGGVVYPALAALPRNVMESCAVRAEDARGKCRDDGRDQRSVGEEGEHPGVHFPFGPSIPSVAGSAYVTEPTDASTIRRPVSRATGGADARPASNALTCSTPGGSPPCGEGEITAHGQLLHMDRQMALAEVYVRDARDRLAAHCTSRCSVFPQIDESIQLLSPDEPAVAETEPETPDPYLREPPVTNRGHPRETRDGVELLRAQLRGELPLPPSTSSPASDSSAPEPGRVVFALPASPWLRNEWGTVYGGILTLLAKSAAAAAVQATASRGTSFKALDVKINFLHAVPADGRELLATGTVLHRGKRLAIAAVEVMQGDVRVGVLTGTTALNAVRERVLERPTTSSTCRAPSLNRPHVSPRQVCPRSLSGTRMRAS
jgi:uncharacterized protein (TIGR00369 family)